MKETTTADGRHTGMDVDTSAAGEMRRALDAQRAELNALTDDVRDLADAVAALADHLNAGATTADRGHAPWCWLHLDDDAAARLWHDLTEWVRWLRGRYPIAEQLSPCWSMHPELVEELTALHAVWNAAYLDPNSHPSAVADFHDRWLPGMLARIRTWGVHCGTEHRDRAEGVYDPAPHTASKYSSHEPRETSPIAQLPL